MVSREIRLFVICILIFLMSSILYIAGTTVVVLLLLIGIGVLGSQIYLAATGDDIAPRIRIRFGVLATLVIVVGYYNAATPSERLPLAIPVAVLVVSLLIYEVVSGYYTSITS
jgi:hypothetical protein